MISSKTIQNAGKEKAKKLLLQTGMKYLIHLQSRINYLAVNLPSNNLFSFLF